MGEHHLSFISRVATNWSYADATKLVNEVRRRPLLRGGSGRQSSPDIVPRDRNEVAMMSMNEAQGILRPFQNLSSAINSEDVVMTAMYWREKFIEVFNKGVIEPAARKAKPTAKPTGMMIKN